MRPATLLQLAIIVVGVGLGAFFSRAANQHVDHGDAGLLASHDMDHGTVEVANDSIVPEIVGVEVTKDSMAGWNLHLRTKNFRFRPEHVGEPHVAGEGHAHVLVNGKKLARLYGPHFHIASLPGGEGAILVTLNANSHKTMTRDGVVLAKSAEVTAKSE